MLCRISVSIGFLLLLCSLVYASDTIKVSIEIPSPCYTVEKVEGNKVYLKSPDKPCIQVIGRTYIDISPAITSVYTYVDGRMWKEQKVLPVEGIKQEHIETAKKYEYLKENVDISKIQNPVLGKDKQDKHPSVPTKADKQTYIFYLFSKSVPDVTVESVFLQAKKLSGVNFYGVLRGIDKQRAVLEKMKEIKNFKDGDITIKINPLIFKAVGANMVPAVVYAYCPPPEMFRSADCDFRYVVYGDVSLAGALEIIGRHSKDAERLYKALKDL